MEIDGYAYGQTAENFLTVYPTPSDRLVRHVLHGVLTEDLSATTVALAPEVDPVLSDRDVDFYRKIFEDPETDVSDPHKPRFSPAAVELAQTAVRRWAPEIDGLPAMTGLLADMYLHGPARSTISISHGIMLETKLAGNDTQEETRAFVAGTLRKVLGVREALRNLQSTMADGEAETVTQHEALRNQTAYALVDRHLDETLPDRAYSAIGLQSDLMGEVTSNDMVVMPNLNYRALSIGVETRYHSLYPTLGPIQPRMMLAGRDAWIPHIEAVGAGGAPWVEGESGTLGFMRLVDTNPDGSIKLIERPCIMVADQVREAMLENDDLHQAVMTFESLPAIHDMYHNVQPVFSTSFLLHQIDQPITLGGYRPAYERWGEGVRLAASDYEIGVARMHLDTFNAQLESDPNLRPALTEKILSAYEALEAAQQGGVEGAVIRNIVEHASTKLLSMFRQGDEIFEKVTPYLERLLPQGLSIDSHTLLSLITTEAPDFDTSLPFADAWRHLMEQIEVYPTGAQAVFRSLSDMGVIDAFIHNGQVSGWQRIRWTAINAPADPELRGHMEKVHGSEGIHYGIAEVVPPLEIVRRQHAAIDQDAAIYEERKDLLQARQDAMVGIFNWLTRDLTEREAVRTPTELALDTLFVAILDHDTQGIQHTLENIAVQGATEEERELLGQCAEYFLTLREYEERHQVSVAVERDRILARKSTNPE